MHTPSFSLVLASVTAGESILKGKKTQTYIITGPRGGGKTTLCQILAKRCRTGDINLGGILTIAQMQAGLKTGIILKNLATGERCLLGSATPLAGYQLNVGRWYFKENAIGWGNACLKDAAGCDVVIFDECGFLELEEQKGFTAGLELFDQQKFGKGIVVVRPELVPTALARWPDAQVLNLEGSAHD
jgi:nucleoside-triphosphatase THEP1